MNKSEVGLFFDILEDKMGELNMTNKADRIFNIDESGFQLKTSPSTVVAPKVVGLKEKLPDDSDVFLNEQSAYINAQLFFVVIKKFVDYFHISKESPAILILDGHDSHCSNPDILGFAVENGLCLLCLPPHNTNWLQPADKVLFAPLKRAYYDACSHFVRNHSRAFTKVEFGHLIKEASERVATVGLASNSFRAT
ncbi:hypothetical protein PR048_012392, partial [Dryococelus australis]